MKTTLIRVTENTKDKLDKQKVHPRQSYDEVIDLMVSEAKVLPKLKKGTSYADNQTGVKKSK